MKNYRTFSVAAAVLVAVFSAFIVAVGGGFFEDSKPVVNAVPVAATIEPGATDVAMSSNSVSFQDVFRTAPKLPQEQEDTSQVSSRIASYSASDTSDDAVSTNSRGTPQQLAADQLATLTSSPPLKGGVPAGGGGSSATGGGSSGGSTTNTTASGGAASSGSASGGGSSSSGGESSSSTSGTSSTTNTTAAGGGTGISIPTDLMKPQNIAAVFLRPEELTSKGQQLPLSTTMNNLQKYKAFWSAKTIADSHPDAWRTLRTQYRDRLALLYVTPVQVNSKIKEYMKGIYSVAWLDYDYINDNHPEWFLLKDNTVSNRDFKNIHLRIPMNLESQGTYEDYSYRLDVGNSDFQDWAVEQFLNKLDPVSGVNARIQYSGIGADVVQLNIQYSMNNLYPKWKYRDGGWNQAYFSYLRKLHDALNRNGYILVANQSLDYNLAENTDWADLMEVVDGAIDESTLLFSALTEVSWNNTLKHHEELIQNKIYDWWIANPSSNYLDGVTQEKAVLFAYCSFLLVKEPALSLFSSYKYDQQNNPLVPWFDFYDIPLGNPVSVRYQNNGCWLRDYQYGKVAVNPTNDLCTVPLDSNTYTLDWRTKKKITQLRLESRSATLLLPTVYPVN